MDINLLLIVFGALTLILIVAIAMNKVIFFDTESDLYTNILILVCAASLSGVLSLYPNLIDFTLPQLIFFWLGVIIFGLALVFFIFSTFSVSIKGNGFLVGFLIALYKILFSLIITLIIFGKIGEILDNKDRRTRANRAPLLAILVLLRIFYTPIKNFLVNGDVVREKRKFEIG